MVRSHDAGRRYAARHECPRHHMACQIVEEHLDICLDAGINHEGINAEVAKGQWKFQIFGKGSKKAADEMWVARYNYARNMASTSSIIASRSESPIGMAPGCTPIFDKAKAEHIAVYGPDNHMRLTGLHETQAIDMFSYGVAGASIRVPHSFVRNGYKGYLEDRRSELARGPLPNSRIPKTVASVPTSASAAPSGRPFLLLDAASRLHRPSKPSMQRL